MNPAKYTQKVKKVNKKPGQEKSKIESKSELERRNERPIASSVKEIVKKEKNRSGSLSRHEQSKIREFTRKSQSVDRSQSDRQHISTLKSHENKLPRTERDPRSVKTPHLKTNFDKRINTQRNELSEKEKKSGNSLEKIGRKTNLEVAKSFVKNVSRSKPHKSTKNISVEKKSAKQEVNNILHDVDSDKGSLRPRTSTLHKGPPGTIQPQLQEKEHNEERIIPNVKSRPSSNEILNYESENDDRASYEDDFEEYDSDFEETDTDSMLDSDSVDSRMDEEEKDIGSDSGAEKKTSNAESNASGSLESVLNGPGNNSLQNRKRVEKTFLKMSDRSSLSTQKEAENSTDRKPVKLSRSFINFASAVEMEEKKKYNNRVLKRASELLDIITLDVMSYDLLDIPPMKYETYIRTFGKSDSKQVFVQTENLEEEEVQTDEIERLEKWTQNPPSDVFGCGGDNVGSYKKIDPLKSLLGNSSAKLSSFLQKSKNIILTLLEEEFTASSELKKMQKRKDLFYSDGFYLLPPLEFLKDTPVANMYCCSDSCYIIAIHDGKAKLPFADDERGIICVWNVCHGEKPEHILMACSQPTCASFDPRGNDVVIAGMVDGSVVLWDLLKVTTNRPEVDKSGQTTVHPPTYNTAAILGNENHSSCVVAVQTFCSDAGPDSKSLNFTRAGGMRSFHALTLEEMGVINVWVIVEVLKPDISGLETDLGLAPGGKLRLVKSSTLLLRDINMSVPPDPKSSGVRTFDFRLTPFDLDRILITTDEGMVIHATRHGGSCEPRFYSGESEFPCEVRCIDCSPHIRDLFLVGCSDGSARLHSMKLVHPLSVFLQAAEGDPVVFLQWSPVHPAEFCVLGSSRLHLWNVLEDSAHPVCSYRFDDARITWFMLRSSEKTSPSLGLVNMLLSKDTGEIEVHMFHRRVPPEEYSKQLNYMQNI